jgi:hypothetical protein
VQPSAYPTNCSPPVDTEVTKSYGEVGQIPDAMFKPFISMFQGNRACAGEDGRGPGLVSAGSEHGDL